ncbi:response regulator [Paraburkholderia gardini]|uniref:Sensor histidine kinase RcsC n=1 Tax=Paraburkholderia gardini TaxID=2823469 RepID=A0ABM8U2X3_9BURK|nr:response regulator [Paraburkholderia gardini]CAG4896950.1 Sensor histidine kinase RcsC [Paraburkholderia gardini]
MKVLLVDDHRDTVDVLAGIVADLGHQPLIAYTGREALEVAEREAPDLIFLDISLTDMDGVQVCRAMRARCALRYSRIVALTGFVEFDRSEEPMPFDARLIKPVSFDVFEHFLR